MDPTRDAVPSPLPNPRHSGPFPGFCATSLAHARQKKRHCVQVAMDDFDIRLQQLNRRIELKTFELECASYLAEERTKASDSAWLLSIFSGPVGTLLAVIHGRHAGRWDSRSHLIEQELTLLLIDRKELRLEARLTRALSL